MDERDATWATIFEAALSSRQFIKTPAKIHPLSTCAVMLEMLFDNHVLAKGTGWFWRQTDGIALVTAWHNFSGLHHTEREFLSSKAASPHRIRYQYVTKDSFTFQSAEIPLYLDEGLTLPRWLVHPLFGSFFDMAFLALQIDGADVNCVNDFATGYNNRPQIASDVFAIGFPQGVSMSSTFPVWKRGTIASDPDLGVFGLPKFFVDMAGRGGLSGAPVFNVQTGSHIESTGTSTSFNFEDKIELLGLYTGRAADQLPVNARSGESTDLGFVWRIEFVEQMLAKGLNDTQPARKKGKFKLRDSLSNPGIEN